MTRPSEGKVLARLVLSVCFAVVGLLSCAAGLPESLWAACVLVSWLFFGTAAL